MPKIKDPLSDLVDFWTQNCVSASRCLVKLYRSLGDGAQASRAIQAGASSEEKLLRSGLRLPQELESVWSSGSETEGEAKAWSALIASLSGMSVMHDFVEEGASLVGLRGSRTQVHRALVKALQGYQTAFPESVTEAGLEEIINSTSKICARDLHKSAKEEHNYQDDVLKELENHIKNNISIKIKEAMHNQKTIVTI